MFPGDNRALLWFVRNRFTLWEALVEEAEDVTPDLAARRRRFRRTLRQAKQLLLARLIVTILLAMGLVATIVSAALATATLDVIAEEAQAFEQLLARIAALATSLSALLLVARLMLERAINRYDVVAAFLASRLD